MASLPATPAVAVPETRGVRSRQFCFTDNGRRYEQQFLESDSFQYVVYGREVAPTTGTLHGQGFIRYRNARSMAAVIAEFPGVHFEVARGTAEQNIAYCTKDGDFSEKGERPSSSRNLQGMLYDLSVVDEMLGNVVANCGTSNVLVDDMVITEALADPQMYVRDVCCALMDFIDDIDGDVNELSDHVHDMHEECKAGDSAREEDMPFVTGGSPVYDPVVAMREDMASGDFDVRGRRIHGGVFDFDMSPVMNDVDEDMPAGVRDRVHAAVRAVSIPGAPSKKRRVTFNV